jgi:outer membrane protein, heavy metal efflux system
MSLRVERVGDVLIVLALVFADASPGAVEALRLPDALVRAAAASPAVRTAEADLAAAHGRLRQARLLPANPVLSGDLARHTAPGEAMKDRGVALDQEIEVGGQRGLRITAAEHDVARAELALADHRRLTEGEVRRAFFGVAAADRRCRLAGERLALASRLAATARQRVEAGDAPALERRLGDLETVRAEHERARAEAQRERAVLRLADALGASPEEQLVVVTDADPGHPAAAEGTLVERALAGRPDLAAARAEHARLEAEADLTRRQGIVPNPVLRGFYREELLNERIAGGGISLPLPLWNRQQGRETELLALARGASTQTALPREVHVALLRRRAAEDTWRRYEAEALPAAAAAGEELDRALRAHYIGLADALVQQDRLLQSRQAAIDAWLELREADADLIEAVGGDIE